ncbi:MAG: HAMP domain-containing histidine kinase [Nitrospira sp.]|nr:HAMP domain-containing histidine kinase [Nitrospira sp.]
MLENHFKRIVWFLSDVPQSRIKTGCFILLILLTFADYSTGLHYGFSIFYLLAVLLLTWFVNLSTAITFSSLSILSWFLVRSILITTGNTKGFDYVILTGEAAVRLLFLITTSYVLNLLKKDYAIRAKQNEELIELGNLKNYFVGITAHDLRNPLSIIELSSSVLLDNGRKNLTQEQLSLAEMIYKKSLYMMKLIEDYLDITKIEAGYLEVNKSYNDYAAFIEEIVSINEILANKKNIHIHIEKETDIPILQFDRNKINQVVNNLLFNALHYSDPDTAVKVVMKTEESSVITEFIDTGPGVDAEDVSRLFEIYYRSKKRKERGTGLGLAISKKIVEAHNGKIGFRKNTDSGSTFWFTLPIE